MNKYLINKPMMLEEIDFGHINDDLPRYGHDFDYGGEKSNWCVYMHINKTNNKMYIGITSDLRTRWKGISSYKQCTKFYASLLKYGWNNFHHIVIMNCLTRTMAGEIERELISKYKTQDSNFGYNITDGGDYGHSGYPTYYKNVHMYDLHGRYIQSFSSRMEAAKLIDSKNANSICAYICKAISSDNHYSCGFLWNNELVDSMEPFIPNTYKFLDDYNRPTKTKHMNILKYAKDGTFVRKYNSIFDVDPKRQIQAKTLRALNGYNKGNCYNGHIWIFEKDFSNEYLQELILEAKTLRPTNTPVLMFDLDGKIIREFNSINEASKYTQISSNSISCCCNKRQKTASGYQFRFKGDSYPGKYTKESRRKIPIVQIDIETNKVLNSFQSLKEASRYFGKKSSHTIKYVAEGHRESAYGYIWRYVDQNNNIIEPENLY